MSWFTDTTRCYRGGSLHHFEPRYDEREREGHTVEGRIRPDDLRKLITVNTYVRDVCVWCGKTIERSTAGSNPAR